EDPVVVNGRSCMGCHYPGIKPFRDAVRELAEKQAASDEYNKASILRLYAPQSEIDRRLDEDAKRFKSAVEQAGGVVSSDHRSEPISALARKYNADLNVPLAAAEAGLEPKRFQSKIAGSNTLRTLGYGQLLVEEGGFKRDAWEEHFHDLVSGLGLGGYVPSALLSAKRGMLLICADDWTPRFAPF